MAKGSNLTAEIVRRLLDYDSETGLLTWKARTPDLFQATERRSAEHKCDNWNAKCAGRVAGCPHGNGYLRVGIFGVDYFAHRVIWLIVTGEWPVDQIDHINLDRSCNRWANLRLATSSQNGANKAHRRGSASRFKGVHWDRLTSKWRAQAQVMGKRMHLGSFATAEQAASAYEAAAQKYFGEFARV